MKKYFYITAEISEEVPSYNFVLEADNEDHARELAEKIITSDYDYYRKFEATQLAERYGDQDHNGREAGFELLELLKLN